RSVLEIEQAATLALCAALRRLGDRHAVHAFSGEGRRQVRVLRIKGFAEDPAVAPARIAGLAPDRYTPLGATLRHLGAALAEQSATHALCEARRRLGDRHAVHAFAGEGGRPVRVLRIKGFAEDPAVAPARIAGLAPDRYTRLGAPLRHLAAALAREPARRRLLLLLSDGKPNDEDEYEGRYGVEDVRQAVVEARLLGLDVFCLTVDREGSRYLPRMFGPWGYAVLPDVRQLPERLLDLYRRLTASGP